MCMKRLTNNIWPGVRNKAFSVQNNSSKNILLIYFSEISKTYKVSLLWLYYSKIKSNVLIQHNVFSRMRVFLKQNLEGYRAEKSKIRTKEEVMLFLKEAGNEIYLMVMVNYLLKFIIHKYIIKSTNNGCCWGYEMELLNLLVSNIWDNVTILIVNVKDTKTNIDQTFEIINPTNESSLDFLRLYRKYACFRPPHTIDVFLYFIKIKNTQRNQ